ncbi:acyl-CoA dehydrogenase [Steroidobacter denitrificans]|uniref:Acyl-CoA dehydrogenase n=1 Tax=Steroidobacter denitrificans TaxID=465721 RepID=A0A127F7R2_STEDE|nr:acyl-CoA dehydrogenase family protein [Steroidobacter denitrificans]AMN45579.1 acyl-CoA dehydrogenase [Steroidobacter denitrificans]
MDLRLTEEQRQIAQSVEQLLARASDSTRMRHAAFDGGGFDAELWAQLGELGACGLHIPEAHGGLGLGATELALVAEALGRRLACVPWLESLVLAGTTLMSVGEEIVAARWLPSLASGEQVLTLATGLLENAPPAVRREGECWQLDGLLPAVPAAMAAHWLLLSAQAGQERLLLAVDLDAPGVSRRPRANYDATRPVAEVRLQGVQVRNSECLASGAAVDRALEQGRRLAAVVLAAEQVGVAQQCLDMTVAYLGERVQFGKPLATFQALKHRCATMMVAVELARSAVQGAAHGLDGQPDETRMLRLATMACSLADDAAQYCTQEAIQLHGGVGFTWEYDPHLYFKRAQAARAWLTPPAWRERLAAALLDEAVA